jgi:hypothetical protein
LDNYLDGEEMIDGWTPLIQVLELYINSYYPDLQWNWKEKYGSIRLEIQGGYDNRLDMLEEFIENMSERTCDICGKLGHVNTERSWMATRCEEHWRS